MSQPPLTDDLLWEWVNEARSRSIELTADLTTEQLSVPYLPTVNPILWELCHAAHFHDVWVVREGANQDPCNPLGAALFDSMTIGHEERWRLDLPDRAAALEYVRSVRDRVLGIIEQGLDDRLRYLIAYSVFHEGMHTEALTYTRQTLGYAAPALDVPRSEGHAECADLGDAELPGGTFMLGAGEDTPFCFDNEKWAHVVEIAPFSLSRTAVTEGEFAEFVLDGGYVRSDLWSAEGWAWRNSVHAERPLYWRRAGEGFEVRQFDTWVPLAAGRALIHVCYYEAEAWCRWAKRRLPTEAEWEFAASGAGEAKRVQPWGDQVPTPGRANLDWSVMGPAHVAAFEAGDSAHGLRQMVGNVWEWTSTTFAPYPGFTPDMYVDYSQATFHTRKVLRGGCYATRSRTIRNTWRNFFQPYRRDVFAGFRACPLAL